MTDPSEDFAAMFEASIQAKRLTEGQMVEGTIVAIGPEVAFVDVGGKGEASIDLDELKDADGRIEVAVGERVQAMVVSTSGGVTLSRKLARGAATDRQLEDAFRTGLPVEGKVVRPIKGGYEVLVGRQRGFCPASQIATVRTADPAVHDGQVYEFRIIEYSEGGRNLVLSRRALLEEEERAAAAEVRRSIVEGAVLTGRVASVRDFGAFVDLGGGVQGLLHVSEMAWSHVSSAAQVVAVGDQITVKVLRADENRQKISLGLKQLGEDPWSTVGARYQVGAVRTGRVTRVTDFGAFVELEPGVEALAHISTFAPSGQPLARRIAPGTEGAFEILTIDPEKKRIGVALLPEGSARGDGARQAGAIVQGARLTGKVERHEPFGVFVFLAPGRTGLIPWSETGIEREADAARSLPVGSDVDVIVLEADPSGRRIRLSARAAAKADETEELRAYSERSGSPRSEELGSLADKLRSAFGARDK